MSKQKQKEFLALYEPVHESFERFCRVRVYGDFDFQDLMNESLLIAYEKFDQLKSEHVFLSFLIGISIRILGTRNQKIREVRMASDQQAMLCPDDSTDTTRLVNVHYLYESLAMLGEEQRECIILFEISGFSIREIAAIQQVSEDAVKQRLRRGRKKLTEVMTFESAYQTGISHE